MHSTNAVLKQNMDKIERGRSNKWAQRGNTGSSTIEDIRSVFDDVLVDEGVIGFGDILLLKEYFDEVVEEVSLLVVTDVMTGTVGAVITRLEGECVGGDEEEVEEEELYGDHIQRLKSRFSERPDDERMDLSE